MRESNRILSALFCATLSTVTRAIDFEMGIIKMSGGDSINAHGYHTSQTPAWTTTCYGSFPYGYCTTTGVEGTYNEVQTPYTVDVSPSDTALLSLGWSWSMSDDYVMKFDYHVQNADSADDDNNSVTLNRHGIGISAFRNFDRCRVGGGWARDALSVKANGSPPEQPVFNDTDVVTIEGSCVVLEGASFNSPLPLDVRLGLRYTVAKFDYYSEVSSGVSNQSGLALEIGFAF